MLSLRLNATSSLSMRARVLLLASVAALVATSFEAHAAPVAATSSSARTEAAAAADGAEFGARKRVRRGNNAAGLAMMGMMVGTIGAAIAAQQRRDAYERAYNRQVYGGGYYYPQPYVQPQPYIQPQPYVYSRPHAYANPRVQQYYQQRGINVLPNIVGNVQTYPRGHASYH